MPLGVTHPCESCIEMRFFLTYRALKVAGNYRPGRRKMGFNLWFEGAMPSGVSHKLTYACRASFALSKHCLCHYNGAWLAFVSFTLSKHRSWTPKTDLPRCLSVLASIAFVYPKAARWLSVTLCKHRWCNDVACFVRTVVHSQQASHLAIHTLACRRLLLASIAFGRPSAPLRGEVSPNPTRFPQ